MNSYSKNGDKYLKKKCKVNRRTRKETKGLTAKGRNLQTHAQMKQIKHSLLPQEPPNKVFTR